MNAALFFEHPLWSRLAAMHAHFLWQGLLIACLYWAVVKLFNIHSARLRYLFGMSGLAAMMLSTIATFWLSESPKPQIEPSSQAANDVSEASMPSLLPWGEKVAEGRMRGSDLSEDAIREVPLTLAGHRPKVSPPQGRGGKTINSSPPLPSEPFPKESQSPLVPVLLGGWFLGVMIFGLRLLGGVGTVIWWRWSSLAVTDPYWVELVHRLSRESGRARPPRLAVSLRAEDAFSLGLFRPVIVLPAAWLLKLPPDALENVLAHELAHIRRFDAWANLFQRVLEAWLFYHPAVWWLSRRMDEEREKCTDLWAVSLTGDRLRYVKTLAGIAEFQREARLAKSNGPILATGMGGKNMVLLERVRHILGQTPRTGAASRFLAGAMVLAIPMALWVGTMMLPASAQEGDAVIAQADDDEKRGDREDGDRDPRDGERRDGDRPREDGERRDGDRPREDGERRDGDRPRGERERDGDRPRSEGARDSDRPRPEGQRDGDRPRGEGPRDGDRPRPEGERRDGDRPRGEAPRDGEARPPVFPPRGLPGGGPPRFREFEIPRIEGGPAAQGELIELIRELRREVAQLRQEVRELREGREGGERQPGFRGPDGDFRPGFRPMDRRPDGERREGDRPDGEGDSRVRTFERRVETRRDGEAPAERERNEAKERLEEARESLDEAREAEREAKDRPKGEDKDEGDRPERDDDDQ